MSATSHEQNIHALLESTRHLLACLEADDSAGWEQALAERARCLTALGATTSSTVPESQETIDELRSLEAGILAMARQQLESTRDELGQIRSARSSIERNSSSDPIPHFVSQRA